MVHRWKPIEVNLFPFLSVLCAVIGVLVLFVTLVLGTRIVEEQERFLLTEDHQRQVAPGRDDEVIEHGIDPESYAELERELERLRLELQQRQEHRDRLLQRFTALEDLLDFKKTELLIPVIDVPPREFNRPEPVEMVPAQGFEVNLTPIIVEVAAAGYTVYPSRERFAAIREQRASDGDATHDVAPELRRFLQDVDRRSRQQYLVFLIHPNGVEAFDNLRAHLRRAHQGIQIGWEPFSRDWIVAAEAQP